ncbi:hypothetical protein B7494_g1958 [Chlorociboria aeruginascens]|nr:hypothetical protein B7494_g1958 [Chlorociboria aeruginascens]
MGRLIPLLLQPQLASDPLPTFQASLSTNSTTPPNVPPKSILRPVPVTALILLPYTRQEWKKVMEAIKSLYLGRKYRDCSARCIQILDSMTDPYRIHPLYSTYLCFFAATCLELTARSFHNNSASKIPMLQKSLTYYNKAESYIEYATFSSDPTILNMSKLLSGSSSLSPRSPSTRSSIDSVFSESSSYSTSPTFSTSSTDSQDLKCQGPNRSETMRPQPLKIKKSVSFTPEVATWGTETKPQSLERPTTPETEMDEGSSLLDAFPLPPSSPSSPLPTFPTRTYSSPPPPPANNSLTRSLTLYSSDLSSLRTQIHTHCASVTHLITSILEPQNPPLASSSDFSHHPASSGWEGVDKDAVKKMQLQNRIERLRKQGWKRERFCGERYRVLCERALGDLVPRE